MAISGINFTSNTYNINQTKPASQAGLYEQTESTEPSKVSNSNKKMLGFGATLILIGSILFGKFGKLGKNVPKVQNQDFSAGGQRVRGLIGRAEDSLNEKLPIAELLNKDYKPRQGKLRTLTVPEDVEFEIIS